MVLNEDLLKTAEDLISILSSEKLTISTAESCTGGMLGTILTNFSGVSEIYMGGAITYSNEAKMKMIGVKGETLQEHGAVSSNTAIQMADGIRKVLGTNIGVSTTGIAGPTGGTIQKPVGLVYIAVSTEAKTEFKELRLRGDRDEIRQQTCMEVFNLVKSVI